MKSINQINSFVDRNQVINLYNELGRKYDRYEMDDYRNRYFNFAGDRRMSITGNFIFISALTDLNRYRGAANSYSYNRDNKAIYLDYDFAGSHLQFKGYFTIDIAGVFLTIESNFKPLERFYKVRVKSNRTFENLDYKSYLEKVLRPFLFADGIFRNIQIITNCSKADAISFYKRNVSAKKEKPEQDREDIESKAWKQIFKRRLNISINDYFTNQELSRIFKIKTRQQKRKQLLKEPSVFQLSEMYLNEYDTDIEIESFVTDYFSDDTAIFA